MEVEGAVATSAAVRIPRILLEQPHMEVADMSPVTRAVDIILMVTRDTVIVKMVLLIQAVVAAEDTHIPLIRQQDVRALVVLELLLSLMYILEYKVV